MTQKNQNVKEALEMSVVAFTQIRKNNKSGIFDPAKLYDVGEWRGVYEISPTKKHVLDNLNDIKGNLPVLIEFDEDMIVGRVTNAYFDDKYSKNKIIYTGLIFVLCIIKDKINYILNKFKANSIYDLKFEKLSPYDDEQH